MKKALLLLAMLPLAATTLAQNTPLQAPMYAVSPYQDSIYVYTDTTNFTVDFAQHVQLTDTAGGLDITGANGLTVHPCTGEYWAMVKISGQTGRSLATVNVNDGICQIIGNTGDNFASITFVDDTTIVGVTGDGATNSESLYFIDMNTAAITLIGSSTAGSDGESAAYCPDDSLVYRWSGRNTNNVMEAWDVSAGTFTNVPITGFDWDEIFGATYIGGGEFLLANLDQEFVIVDTSGFATLLGPGTHEYNKGIAFPSRYVWYASATPDSICPYGDSMTLVATPGADAYQWYLDGSAIAGATNDTIQAIAGGSYKCEITRGTCVAFSDDSLMVNTYPVDTAIVTPAAPAFCVGDSVTLTGNTGAGDSEWYDSNNSLLVVSPTYTATAGGTYFYRLYSTNGCYDLVEVVVTENPLPTIVANSNGPEYCDGEMITLTGSGGDVYTWDNSVVDGVPFSQAIGMTQYIVTGTDTLTGCSNVDTIDVQVHPNPEVNGTGTDEMLGNDGSIDLTVVAGTGLTFDWDNDGTGDFDDTEDLSGLTAGTYTVIAMAPTGCSDTASVTIGSQVGLEEFGQGAALLIYPNPNDGKFTVSMHNMVLDNLNLQIVNSAGQIVYNEALNSEEVDVNISEFGAGQYMLVISNEDHAAAKTIIVK